MAQFLKQEVTTDPLWKAGLVCIQEAMTTFFIGLPGKDFEA